MSDSDDRELLARLQAADPAQRTPVPPRHWISDLTEATMNDTNTDETRSDQGRRRTWVLVAAAAVIVGALGVGGVAALNGDDPLPTTAPTTATKPSVTEVEAPAEAAAMCMIPDAKTLTDNADLAVDGVVVSTKGDKVTLDVSHWYAGEPTDQLVVTAPSADLMPLLGSVDLEEGSRYLLSSEHGQLIICGFSGRYDASLAALYNKAFTK